MGNVFAKLFAAKTVFACSECDESFDEEDELKEHFVEEHVEAEETEVFACSECDTKHDEEDNAKEHFVSKHQDVLFEHFSALVTSLDQAKRELAAALREGARLKGEAERAKADLAALRAQIASAVAPGTTAPVAPSGTTCEANTGGLRCIDAAVQGTKLCKLHAPVEAAPAAPAAPVATVVPAKEATV